MRVLDLGGTPRYWRDVSPRPLHLTLVNLQATESVESWIECLQLDACEPNLDGQFDLVVSNSVIEHLGGHWRRQQFADVVHRMADRHWIQTPNRYFPMEPHWVAPDMQFLPMGARAIMAQHWPIGHIRSDDWRGSIRSVLETELLSSLEMTYYFGDSELWKERVCGMTKSLVSVLVR